MKHKPHLRVEFSGYGHYKVFTTYYGREIRCTTTNMQAVDNFKDDCQARINKGYEALRAECISKNKN